MPREGSEVTKIARAVVYELRHEGHPTRKNETCCVLAEGTGAEAMAAIGKFPRDFLPRSMLVLELENGLEITIYDALKPEVPALEEEGSDGFDYNVFWAEHRTIWDPTVELWPVLPRGQTAVVASS